MPIAIFATGRSGTIRSLPPLPVMRKASDRVRTEALRPNASEMRRPAAIKKGQYSGVTSCHPIFARLNFNNFYHLTAASSAKGRGNLRSNFGARANKTAEGSRS